MLSDSTKVPQRCNFPHMSTHTQDPNIRTLLCTGGWSGWHILPIIILHDALQEYADIRVIWIGESDSMDEDKAKEHDIEFYRIPAVKFRRYLSLQFFIQPFLFLSGFIQAWKGVSKISPDIVFCKWGWVALAVVLVAKIKGIPILTHESDTVPGMTNSIAGKWSKKVYLGFSEAAQFFPKNKVEVVGQWIDPIFLEYASTHPYKENASNTQVIVQCGWLGSTKIFTEILSIIKDFSDIQFTVALGTKNEHFFDDFAKFSNVTVKKWFFHEELAAAYARADVGIVRAAANTLAECDVFGIRMIMIPLAIASFDHQTKNAIAFENASKWFHSVLCEENLSELKNELTRLREFKKQRYGNSIKWALPAVKRDILEMLQWD